MSQEFDLERRLNRAIAIRMASAAVGDLDIVDPRTGVALLGAGIIKGSPQESPRSNDALVEGALVGSPDYPVVETAPGPLLFVRQGEVQHCVDIVDFVLNLHDSIRVNALRRLRELSTISGTMHRATADLLRSEVGNALFAESIGDWYTAALRVHRALVDDVVLTCAAARQALEVGAREVFAEHFQQLLRPSHRSLRALGVYVPTRDPERRQVSDRTAELLRSADPSSALEAYMDEFGHLPLDGIGGFRWFVDQMAPSDPWEVLTTWEAASSSSLAEYQRHIYFAEKPEHVPAGASRELLRRTATMMALKRTDRKEGDYTVFLHLIAAYYCKYATVAAPGEPADWYASIAWWLTDRLCRLPILARHAKEEAARHLGRESSVVERYWALSASSGEPSAFKTLTEFNDGVWAVALAGALGKGADRFGEKDILDDAALESVAKAFGRMLLRIVPPAPQAVTYLFERPVRVAASSLAAVKPETGLADLVAAFAPERWTEEEGFLPTTLRSVLDMDESNQAVFFGAVRYLVLTRRVPLEQFFEVLGDAAWLERVMKLPAAPLESLCHAVAVLFLTSRDSRFLVFQHALANESLSVGVDAERRRLCFALVMFLALSTDAVGPVFKMISSKQEWIDESVTHWLDLIEDIPQRAAPLVAARCRAMRLILSGDRSVAVADMRTEGDNDSALAGEGSGVEQPRRSGTNEAGESR